MTKNKEVFVIYWSGDGGAGLKYCTFNDFMKNFNETRLIPIRRIDSEKIEFDNEDPSSWILDYTYIGDKYALMYGGKFISGFIYDDYESRGSRYTVSDIIDMQSNGKFGIIDKYGKVAVPFLFDDVEFIDDNNAFVKYNGKYGVLDVRSTMIEFAGSPPTGESPSIYIVILSFTSLISILFLKLKIRK